MLCLDTSRMEWDSNPRHLSVLTFSKRAPSTTQPPIHAEEAVRFELTTPCGAPVFETDAFSLSATLPFASLRRGERIRTSDPLTPSQVR